MWDDPPLVIHVKLTLVNTDVSVSVHRRPSLNLNIWLMAEVSSSLNDVVESRTVKIHLLRAISVVYGNLRQARRRLPFSWKHSP